MRLKQVWEGEFADWNRRRLAGKRYAYLWVDGIHFNVRLEEGRQCILVVMGATEDGSKELVAVEDGVRESEQSWKEVLLGLKARGLEIDPELVIGDGALGFWKALPQVWPDARHQRCWVHKVANVLNKLPKSVQPKAKAALHEISQAETRADAEKAFDSFLDRFSDKYPAAAMCLSKDRDELSPLRLPGPALEASPHDQPDRIDLRDGTTADDSHKGGLAGGVLTMVFKLAQAAERKWRRLNGHALLGELIQGVLQGRHQGCRVTIRLPSTGFDNTSYSTPSQVRAKLAA